MALRRWKWVWGPALAAIVVALLLLPPGLPAERGILTVIGFSYSPWYYPPGMAHRAAIRDAVAVQRRRLERARLADSLLAEARQGRAVRSADGTVTVIYEPPVTADSARVWLRAALGELQLYPKPASRGVPVIVALLSNPRRQRGPQAYDRPGPSLSAEVTGGRACIVTVDVILRPRQLRRTTFVIRGPSGELLGRFLDECALEGRYGAPGTAVSRLASWGPNWYWRTDLLTVRLFEARRTVRKEDVEQWQYSFWYGQVPWVTLGCLGGATDQCALLAGVGPTGSTRRDEYLLGPRMLFASLIANGTAEQFAAFWRSPLPADQALRRAYGRDPGQLAYAALNHWYYAPAAGHGGGTRTVLAGVVWAGIAVAFAAFAGRRRRTEL